MSALNVSCFAEDAWLGKYANQVKYWCGLNTRGTWGTSYVGFVFRQTQKSAPPPDSRPGIFSSRRAPHPRGVPVSPVTSGLFPKLALCNPLVKSKTLDFPSFFLSRVFFGTPGRPVGWMGKGKGAGQKKVPLGGRVSGVAQLAAGLDPPGARKMANKTSWIELFHRIS